MRSEVVTAPPGAVCWARVPCLGNGGAALGWLWADLMAHEKRSSGRLETRSKVNQPLQTFCILEHYGMLS